MHITRNWLAIIWHKWGFHFLEWAIIIAVAYAYCAVTLLDFDPLQLQQTGEQNNEGFGNLLAQTSLSHFGQVPLWNPFSTTGFPYAGDLNNYFWSPVATLPVILWGAINGMKVSVFIGFIIAGLGQWYLAKVCGLRGIFRLWASLTFMLSGGLALFWRVGWVYLFLGAVWFPWVFASFWVALHKKTRSSLIFCAFTVAMTFLTGGGYYPFYLLVTALVILIVAYLTSEPILRKSMLPRALVISLMSAGFVAVYLFPSLGGLKLINRVYGLDVTQNGSQPVLYAMMNYLIAVPEWRDANILGTANGWNWFYLGPLSIVALFFLLPAFRKRRYRPELIAMLALTAIMLLWEANRYAPVKYIYDLIPFLYTLRFPNRLLVIAASPLLIAGGISFQVIYERIQKWAKQYALLLRGRNNKTIIDLNSQVLITLTFILLFFLSVRDTYRVNKPEAFGAHSLDLVSFDTLRWLKNYDPSLYYVDLGGGLYFWSWDPAAYELGLPIINDTQVERLLTLYKQSADDSPFIATPKYQYLQTNQTPAPGAEFVTDIEGYDLWYYPDALPFAFTIPNDALTTGGKLDHAKTVAVQVSYEGLNKVKAIANSDGTADSLVVLVSDYPGWKLNVDGNPDSLTPINYYLGAKLLPGTHTYTFTFDPPLYHIGLAITLYSIWIALIIVVAEKLPYKFRKNLSSLFLKKK
jgi:hypothetical protein